MASTTISDALQAENSLKCAPPLPRCDIETIVRSVSQYNSEDPAVEISQDKKPWSPPEGQICSLSDVQSAGNELMPGCDLVVLRTVIGAYFANVIDEAPVWLLVVGGSSSGKSEALIVKACTPALYCAAGILKTFWPVILERTSRTCIQ